MNSSKIKTTGLWAAALFAASAYCAYAEEKPAAPINQDQINGRVEEAKGAAKEAAGKMLDDKGMQVEGNLQKNVGKAQAGFGDLKKDVQEGK